MSTHETVEQRVAEAVTTVRERMAMAPRVALVLGSGLGALAAEVETPVIVPYTDIPHFPTSTAPGHAGRLVLGTIGEIPVAIMAGRVHLYEGYTAEEVAFPIRVLHRLGAPSLIITNAAGGINPEYHPGTLMLIADHINLTGHNPLIGPNQSELGPRFPDMTTAYSPRLRQIAMVAGKGVAEDLKQGVYLGLQGPSYETPAEIRMFRLLGADAVGMSTVIEVIAANHLGMEVLGISCITNMAAGMLPVKLTEQEVLDTAERVSRQFKALLRAIVAAL
jgi:purine-nucleoside phosphorylase